MWTLQEYCASHQLIVSEQVEDEGVQYVLSSTQDGAEYNTIVGVERIHAESQRLKHLAGQASIMPVWLGDSVDSVARSIPREAALEMWRSFVILSKERHCLYDADRVRAL